LVLLVRYWMAGSPLESPAPTSTEASGTGETCEVVRVVDGDTIIIAPDQRVRLIGVNAPESVKPDHPVEPFGPEASAFTKEFLAQGTCRLTSDREKYDQYHRRLAYVWIGNRLLNEELIREGLAHYERHFEYSSEMKGRFRAAQDEARKARRGIWSRDSNRPARKVSHRGGAVIYTAA